MGPCKGCKKWLCGCGLPTGLLSAWLENNRQYEEALQEHRRLAAQHDPDFQEFMRKVGA
jgi:hypothetical protein